MTKPDPAATGPFLNDSDYLQAEQQWLLLRCEAVALQADIDDELQKVRRNVVGAHKSTAVAELQRRLDATAVDEARNALDARLAVMREAGVVLGVDVLCKRHDFKDDGVERLALIVTTLCALSDVAEIELGRIGPRSYGGNCCVETLWRLLGYNFDQRVASRRSFSPEAPLLRAGLITATLGRSSGPRDLRDAALDCTGPTFATMLGLQEGTAVSPDPSTGAA